MLGRKAGGGTPPVWCRALSRPQGSRAKETLMAINDALFSVTGYVATQPKKGLTKSGTKTLSFRIGWTPREVSRQTGEWADLPSSFASVTCYRKIAENAAYCLRKGDPIVLKGTLRVREYEDQAGSRRNSVDVVADYLGHDLAKGTSMFSKQPQRAQQTADEYELSQAAGDNPMPGDAVVGQLLDGPLELSEPAEYGPAGGADALTDPDRADTEGADGDDPGEPSEVANSGEPGEIAGSGEPIEIAGSGEPIEIAGSGEPIEIADSGATKS